MPEQMQQAPQPVAPAPTPKGGKGWMIVAIIFILLFIAAAVYAGMLMMNQSADDMAMMDMEDQIEEMEEEMMEMEEGTDDIGEEAAEEIGQFIRDHEAGRYGEILISGVDDARGYRGVAELRGYFTTSEEPTTLAEDGPTVECSAFIVTEGPEEAMRFMEQRNSRVGKMKIVLGNFEKFSENPFVSPWYDAPLIVNSTERDTISAVFRIGSTHEGEVVGCSDPQVGYIGTVPSSKIVHE